MKPQVIKTYIHDMTAEKCVKREILRELRTFSERLENNFQDYVNTRGKGGGGHSQLESGERGVRYNRIVGKSRVPYMPDDTLTM